MKFDTVYYGENVGYKFRSVSGFELKELTQAEIESLDRVINKFGNMNTDEIVEVMHNEEAYRCTDSNCIIPFSFADQLSID